MKQLCTICVKHCSHFCKKSDLILGEENNVLIPNSHEEKTTATVLPIREGKTGHTPTVENILMWCKIHTPTCLFFTFQVPLTEKRKGKLHQDIQSTFPEMLRHIDEYFGKTSMISYLVYLQVLMKMNGQ